MEIYRALVTCSTDAVTRESGSEAGLLHEEKALLGGKKSRFFAEGDYLI